MPHWGLSFFSYGIRVLDELALVQSGGRENRMVGKSKGQPVDVSAFSELRASAKGLTITNRFPWG
jgi:hypothetical protein